MFGLGQAELIRCFQDETSKVALEISDELFGLVCITSCDIK